MAIVDADTREVVLRIADLVTTQTAAETMMTATVAVMVATNVEEAANAAVTETVTKDPAIEKVIAIETANAAATETATKTAKGATDTKRGTETAAEAETRNGKKNVSHPKSSAVPTADPDPRS